MTRTLGLLAAGCVVIWGCSSSDANSGDDSAQNGGDGGSSPNDASASSDSNVVPSNDGGGTDASPPLDPRDGPGIFAAAGNHLRHIRSSDDGVTWTDDATYFAESMTGDLYGIRTVSWVNGQFTAYAAKMFTSPDGKTYTEVTKADGQWLASMLYAQGEYVSSGGYGWLATTTTDLGTWTQHPPAANYTAAHHSRAALATGLVAGANAYVSVDDLGDIFYTNDGKTWSASNAPVVPAGTTWGTIFAYGDGVFVGLMPNGTDSIRSIDGGKTFTSNTALGSVAQGLVYAQGKFTAIGAGHIFTSTDGKTWTDHAETSAIAADLSYGHGVYLALNGNDGSIYRSTDGLTFTKAFDNATNPDPIASIAFGPNP